MKNLKYGNVVFLRGQHMGKMGYYDDDEGAFCIVYLGEPCLSKYVRCKPTSIKNITHKEYEKFKNSLKPTCVYFGVM